MKCAGVGCWSENFKRLTMSTVSKSCESGTPGCLNVGFIQLPKMLSAQFKARRRSRQKVFRAMLRKEL